MIKNNSGVSRRTAAKMSAKVRGGVEFPPLTNRANPTPVPRSGPSYADVTTYGQSKVGQVKGLTSYMEMILDPHRSAEDACRYPDETIVPTALVSLQDSITYSVPATTSVTQVSGTLITALKWKVTKDDSGTETISELPITRPQLMDTSFNPLQDSNQAYTQQGPWLTLSSTDRTLAAGIRIRTVGLPVSTFMPSGTVYFIQYQNQEIKDLVFGLSGQGESVARAAVAAKKGFSMTVNELSRTEGVTIPYLPQGPMSFVFSDSGTSAAANAGAYTASTVVSANGGLLIAAFGLQVGQSLRLDYGHVIEYIPRSTAAGLIQTAVQPPSSSMRDSISAGAAMIQQNISGATSLSSIAQVVAGGALTAAANVAKGVVNSIPGGQALASGAHALAKGLGAPSWLTSALNSLV